MSPSTKRPTSGRKQAKAIIAAHIVLFPILSILSIMPKQLAEEEARLVAFSVHRSAEHIAFTCYGSVIRQDIVMQ